MPSKDSPSWRETIIKAVVSLAPLGGPAVTVYADVQARRQAKASEFLEKIDAIVGERKFLERLRIDPRLETLFVEAVQAAVRTSIDSKRRLLANAVADAAIDPTSIDAAELLVEAISQLEVQHVRALGLLAEEWREVLNGSRDDHGWGISEVWKTLPAGVQAALVRTGVGMPTPTSAQRSTETKKRSDGITDFGLEVEAALRAEGWQEEARMRGWDQP